MRKHLEMMKVAVKFEDAEAFTQHDIQFHEAMINASNHQYLQNILESFETCNRNTRITIYETSHGTG